MFKEVLTCVLFIVIVIECSSIKRGYKVHNGDLIQSWADNPFKFIVMLQGPKICTGSIFTPISVLSAGHCFMNPTMKPTHIALEHIKGPVNETIEISETFILSSYQPFFETGETSGLDFSVVRLKSPIKFDKFALATLKFRRPILHPGTTVILVGYGVDLHNNGGYGILRQGRAVVNTCVSFWNDKRTCVIPANNSIQNADSGDSGMPLLTEENEEYFGHGILSGMKEYQNGYKELIFTSYTEHENYIRMHSPRK